MFGERLGQQYHTYVLPSSPTTIDRSSLFPTTKLLLVAYALFTFGCQSERCPEEEPELEFYRYDYQSADPNNTTSTDTLTLIFQFED